MLVYAEARLPEDVFEVSHFVAGNESGALWLCWKQRIARRNRQVGTRKIRARTWGAIMSKIRAISIERTGVRARCEIMRDNLGFEVS